MRLYFLPGCAGANPAAAHTVFQGQMSFMVGDTNSSFGMPFRPGCPTLCKQLIYRTARGPRADTVLRAVALARACNVGMRWDGGGVRPASPVPVASNSALPQLCHRCHRDPHTRHLRHRRARLHAAPSFRLFGEVRMFGAVRPGVYLIGALTNAEGAPITYPGDARIRAQC
ncbi:hypothetical protein V4C53_23515 [Paraburkholderia azotifigens]|uniref:hypothetical protein n=1 Tax=Paraburkholderia azotifigens TaxID=2057004 RepID=UPI003171704B